MRIYDEMIVFTMNTIRTRFLQKPFGCRQPQAAPKDCVHGVHPFIGGHV